jgi:hypothetical protein
MTGRTAKSWALLLSVLIPLAAQAQAAELITQAKGLMAKQKWADAAPMVTKALAEPGNDYESFLTLLEMKGVIAAMTATKQQDNKADYKDAFGKMLSLDPDRRLKGKWPKKAQQAFAEVQRKPPAPLEIETSTATQASGKVTEIAIGLKGDPLKLAKTVVFNWRTVGAKWKTKPVPAVTGRVAAKVDGGKIEWYATVLGENDAELGHLASAEIPMVDKAIGAVADPVPADDDFGKKKKGNDAQQANLTPKDDTKSETPATEVVVEKPSNTTWKSTAGYVAAGLGVVGIGVGSVFGVMSNGARSSFTTGIGKTDPSGFVTGISRAQALQYQSTAQSDALLANLMWGIGGGLLLVGIALKVLDMLGGS